MLKWLGEQPPREELIYRMALAGRFANMLDRARIEALQADLGIDNTAKFARLIRDVATAARAIDDVLDRPKTAK